MEWLEISASSVESAKERALIHLGVHESDAEFEVLSEGRVGLFGRVKEEARVRARVVPTPVRPKDRSRSQSRRAGSSRRSSGKSAGSNRSRSASSKQTARSAEPKKAPAPEKHVAQNKKDEKSMETTDTGGPSLLEQADLAESFVQGAAETLGLAVTFTRHDVTDGVMRIEANGDGIGVLVGRRGGTAQAIDELVRTVLQRSGGTIREGKIRIDIGGVRTRRVEALTAFTRKMADEVLDSGEDVALEPMNRADRKVVHDAVTDIDGVASRSEGEDPHRRVVLTAAGD